MRDLLLKGTLSKDDYLVGDHSLPDRCRTPIRAHLSRRPLSAGRLPSSASGHPSRPTRVGVILIDMPENQVWPKGQEPKPHPQKNDPNGSRTRVCAVKGRRPRPLDDGVMPSVLSAVYYTVSVLAVKEYQLSNQRAEKVYIL